MADFQGTSPLYSAQGFWFDSIFRSWRSFVILVLLAAGIVFVRSIAIQVDRTVSQRIAAQEKRLGIDWLLASPSPGGKR